MNVQKWGVQRSGPCGIGWGPTVWASPVGTGKRLPVSSRSLSLGVQTVLVPLEDVAPP